MSQIIKGLKISGLIIIQYIKIYTTNIPEGANTNFFPQPRSILSTKDGRYAFVGVFGFGLVRIDSETGFQKFYQNDFKYTRGFDISNADKMINEMEWLDDENILLATGNGFRIFNIKKDDYIQEYFKNENINFNVESDKRYWIRNFEIVDKNEVYASVNEGEVFLFNFEDSSIVNISEKIKLTETNASDLFLDKSKNQLWINNQNIGIDLIDIKTNQFLKLRDNNSSLIGKQFNNIIKDKQENIWLSSATDGLLKFDPNKKV